MGDAIWEDCLANLDNAPLPSLNRSLFDHDLFCYENDVNTNTDDLDNFPLTPLQLIDADSSPTNNNNLQNCSSTNHQQLASVSPIIAPAPRALFPKDIPLGLEEQEDAAIGLNQWRSFLDDNCPLRKRVKITVSRDVREKRPSSAMASSFSSPPCKKMRMCSPSSPSLPPTIDSVTPTPPRKPSSSTPSSIRRRRLQTTLRFPRAGESSSRLVLEVPSPIRSDSPLILLPSDEEDNMCENLDQLHNSNKDELIFGPEACAYVPNNEIQIDVNHNEIMNVPEPEFHMEDGKENETNAVNRPAPCVISSDLYARLSNVKQRRSKDLVGMRVTALPQVDAAVAAVTRAAKAYSESLRIVNTEYVEGELELPPPPPLPPRILCGGVLSQRTRVAKRKKGKRKRVLLSFDDREVKPLDLPEGYGDGGLTPLQRYLNSPARQMTTAH